MNALNNFRKTLFALATLSLAFATISPTGARAEAETMAFKLALANAVSIDESLLEFYRKREFRPLWIVGDAASNRRAALFSALEDAAGHGLPRNRYRPEELRSQFAAANTLRELAIAEASASLAYIRFARDLHTGALEPEEIDEGIKRKRRPVETDFLMTRILAPDPRSFLAILAPSDPAYLKLRKELMRLDIAIANGGWGETIGTDIEFLRPGDRGQDVVALRNRLIRMGYLSRNARVEYDIHVENAVKRFQSRHGFSADGITGPLTISALNKSAEERRVQVAASLERLRWLNQPLGNNHVLVNLADFSARIIENGQTAFYTKAVVGKSERDLNTPEFSGLMTHMIVNPVWHVPYSIASKEVLPVWKEDPTAESELLIFDKENNEVDRATIDFEQYSESNFPFSLKQPPGPLNALGEVKFMFPNKYSIYLHDTPEKNLFERDVRAFSHGCVRLGKAHELATFLLAKQVQFPERLLELALVEEEEIKFDLAEPLPIHLVYRTVWVSAGGEVNYRQDIYGRDRKIFDSLIEAGLVS
ncbi:MAG: L,D-transpeptidase family protein [Albidovulum sp.]|nr:L,D-transpeptidase family protein [Albidovulum sp.]